MQTLTLQEAIAKVPAIGATEASERVSDSYQFVSTRNILERVMDDGWLITNAMAQNRSLYSQHRVTLVHQSNLDIAQTDTLEYIPRIELFNSHNRTKRLMFAIGLFRFLCENGLIVASGPAETIRTKHRFSDERLSDIMELVAEISGKFPSINQKVNDFKTREMTEQEQFSFAEYAIKGRFSYRPAMPKRFRDTDRTVEKLLGSRREEDNGNSTWQVFNRVQENLITGIEGFTRPIRGYSDSIRVNQLLWKGAEMSLEFNNDTFNKQLMELLIKDGKKAKISA
jgi:hypothetical protein